MKRIIAGVAAVIVGATVAACGSADDAPASSSTSVGQAARDLGGVFASSATPPPREHWTDAVRKIPGIGALPSENIAYLANTLCLDLKHDRGSDDIWLSLARRHGNASATAFVDVVRKDYCPTYVG